MKKLIIFLFAIFFLFSCDSNYVDTVKEIKLDEQIIVNNYRCNSVKDITAALLKAAYPNDDIGSIRNSMEWEVEGDLGNDSKIIKISYKNASVKMPTYKQGDYVQIFPAEITLFSNNRSFSVIDFVNF